jgi:hypothetical protein
MGALPTFAAGGRITAAQLTSLLPVTANKPSNTTVVSTTTIAADPDLAVAVVGNAVYEIDLHLIYGQGTTAQLTFGWTGPAGANLDWMPYGLDVTVTASQTGSIRAVPQTIGSTQTFGGNSTPTTCGAFGRLVTAGTAGLLTLRWGPSVSSGVGLTVSAGSYLIAKQIA